MIGEPTDFSLALAARARPNVDLTNCDREAIHTPGSIQPQGALVAFNRQSMTVETVSANCDDFLGRSLEALLGRSVRDLFPSAGGEFWDSIANGNALDSCPSFEYPIAGTEGRYMMAALHGSGPLGIIELERSTATTRSTMQFHRRVRDAVSRLRSSENFSELCTAAVRSVREITGFDRVIIYKFDQNWNGNVLAEDKGERGDSYLGLHFPASDIPRQARELYLKKRVRVIPSVHHAVVPLVGENAAYVDLSMASLRAVSPIHLEYLRNMEATASMSISLISEGRLWGLISCTHLSGDLPLAADTRAVCEILGEVTSSLLALRENDHDRHAIASQRHLNRLLTAMAKSDDFIAGLIADESAFLNVVNAQGGAIYTDGQFHLIGQTPGAAAVRRIVDWASEHLAADQLFYSDSLSIELPGDEEIQRLASGVLGFTISHARATYVMWFRPEVVQTVSWGGNPNKAIKNTPDGVTLHPRKSFEAWKETVRRRSLSWKRFELEAAAKLRSDIIGIVLLKIEKIGLLNQELRRSNAELDSFAYAASHDLKEPLRGISNYSSLLMRSLRTTLSEEGTSRFETILRLTLRMESLIDSLLSYAQVGRAELEMRENDFNEVIRAALDSLKIRIDESHTTVKCAFDFPRAVFDRVQILEIFTNLIANATKYNTSVHREVEIGWTTIEGERTIFVRDNGIGIEADNLQNVFKIFKRLHARDQFGGGSGTGLTIASKIVERHGGRIWVESTPGSGSTFYFTIASF